MGSISVWIGLVTAFGQLFAGIAGKVYLTSDARLLRKIERDANLAEKLPEPAKNVLADLLFTEVSLHALRRTRRTQRKIDWETVGGALLLTGLSAALDWLFAFLAIRHGWGWWIAFGIVSLNGLLFIIVTLGEIFTYPDESDTDKTAEQQDVEQARADATNPAEAIPEADLPGEPNPEDGHHSPADHSKPARGSTTPAPSPPRAGTAPTPRIMQTPRGDSAR
jgi:hypothetical protein